MLQTVLCLMVYSVQPFDVIKKNAARGRSPFSKIYVLSGRRWKVAIKQLKDAHNEIYIFYVASIIFITLCFITYECA